MIKGNNKARFDQLIKAAPIFGKLLSAVASDAHFLRKAIEPVAADDAFFHELLNMHQAIHESGKALRTPLLIMRTDFMDDARLGPQLIEFNGIAAGMGPFGQRAHELHRYLQTQQDQTFAKWSQTSSLELIPNPAIARLAQGIVFAANTIKKHSNEPGPTKFLMVVQENEDNIFDQHLLEKQLHLLGIETYRRTFKQLHRALSTGDNDRLVLEGVGGIDTVYLRAGYQYCDYLAEDIDQQKCCDTLMKTRIFIEQHRVAVNATVSQQLATSKRVQTLLTSMTAEQLLTFGLTEQEAKMIQPLLGDMRPIDAKSYDFIQADDVSNWVLKNQGEGGGHCIFDKEIPYKLKTLTPEQYPTWALMRRIHPTPRAIPALVVRDGEPHVVHDLINEIGLFTVHMSGSPATADNGYAGYLVRSKAATTTEGGVHSGLGVLDSLAYND
ncbi:glutathione synthase [Vibrio thalassae]|uniref:glutathione synthase n=1 Tax=Vibrio thalassae TaxID=1243014 RepID=UPI000BE1FAB2|nr:glutathione synthase [Vibrio thalassae]